MVKNAEESLQGMEKFPFVQVTDAQALGAWFTGVYRGQPRERAHTPPTCTHTEMWAHTMFTILFLLSLLLFDNIKIWHKPTSLGWGDPLEKGPATHSSMFPWRIPPDREAKLATVHVVAKSQTLTEQPTLSLYFDSTHRSHTNISS